MSDLRRCVLIVDDEFVIAALWSIHVEDMGLEVCGVAATADAAVALAREHRPAIVLMDMRLRGERDGVDAALEIHDAVGSKVIFITGSNEPPTLRRIELDHATTTLIKPVSDRQLRGAIEAALATVEQGVV
jgi:CheY-like chemotaxis protein